MGDGVLNGLEALEVGLFILALALHKVFGTDYPVFR